VISRRHLLRTFAACAMARPLAALSQQPGKIPRIGYLAHDAGPEKVFAQKLRELGYIEGRNIIVEYRIATGMHERLPEFADEMARSNVDVIVAPDPVSFRAAIKATKTIPIVIRTNVDPVAAGMVASLARPGGNVTGVFSLYTELYGKRMELLKELAPAANRIAVLLDGGFPNANGNSANYWVDLTFIDNTPPVISAVAAAPTSTAATITWSTNEASNSRVDYGTSPTSLTQNASNASLVTAHSLSLTGLTTGVVYYYRVTSADASGNSATSPIPGNSPATFTPTDTTPPVITAVTATPGTTTATITWTTDKSSNSRVDYGTSPSSLTLNVSSATLVTSHSINLSGLTGITTYYYRVTSVDSSGNSATSPPTSGSPANFTTADPNPPVISAVTAIPGAGGTATITWTTNKLANSRVDYGTSAGSLTLNVSDPTMVSAHSLSLSGLTQGTTYYYRVTSVDSLNNSVSSPVAPATANFIENALSVWAPSVTPAVVDGGDPGSLEVGMKFRSDAAGSVTGVRFYKAAANIGTHIGHLWSSTGTLLGTVTFTNETGSGWQQANFSTPISIAANTTYVVSYFAPSGHYSYNANYFAAGVDNPPLHALATGIDGPNGLYTYGSASAFPSSSANAANYWVDLVFHTP